MPISIEADPTLAQGYIKVNGTTAATVTSTGLTTASLQDAAVTTAKILDANVTTAKVADAAITPAKLSQPYTLATSQASTSGTSIDFTGIPSWAKRVSVLFSGVSTNGSSPVIVQLGTAGGIVASGYLGSANAANYTTGFSEGLASASAARHGTHFISLVGSNTWAASVVVGASGITPSNPHGGFSIALGGTLTQLRITTVNGTDTFDAGSINIAYE